MSWLLLAVIITTGQPQVEVLQPHLSATRIERDARNMPAHHFDLIQEAGRLTDANRAGYFSMLDSYLAEALDCDNPEKVTWALEMAYRTYSTAEIRDIVAPRINHLVLDQPACFLDALLRMGFMARPEQAMDRFIVAPEVGDGEALRKALYPLLATEKYSTVASLYDRRMAARAEREAREEERRQRLLSIERRNYRKPLLEPGFLASDPAAYWALWQEVSAAARSCDDHEAIADLVNAAVLHARIEDNRRHSAEFMEMLILENPACVLNSVGPMFSTSAFEDYLRGPMIVDAEDLLAALVAADVDGEAEKLRRRLQSLLEKRHMRTFLNSQSPARFLRDVMFSYSIDQGRVFIEPPANNAVDDMAAKLASLWTQAEPAGTHSEWNLELRRLPLEALDFMTGGEYPHYQLFLIDNTGVAKTRARPVAAWMFEWFCGDNLLALQLEPAEGAMWSNDRSPPAVVIAFGEEKPLPDVEHSFNEETYFASGKFTWPSEGRAVTYNYTDSYTDPVFKLVDLQTGETRFAPETGRSCH